LYGFRSEALVAIGKPKEAMEDAQIILRLNPNIAEGYYRIGVVYFAVEEYAQAEESFKLGLKYEPDDEKCMLALQDIKKDMIRQQVRNALHRGRQAFEKGEFTLALNYFDEAIEKNPRNCTYYVLRALTKLADQKELEALEDALKIVQLQPNWPKV
jgi:tetratricopeptide (TPR) repeat protein